MMRAFFIASLLAVCAIFCNAQPASAISLKVAPLEYRTSLAAGENKKGFIDISNPTEETVRVHTSVQGFRQTDDSGSLEFFDDEQMSAGVKLDLEEFDLGPREAVRMYFILDGSRLPSGDSYGAIFFTTAPADVSAGVGQQVRLGTLLSLTNGTPGHREAEVSNVSVPLFQFGTTVNGSYRIRNTASSGKATGFYPSVAIGVAPFGETKTEASKLVFAGRTRTNDFSIKTPPLGIYRVGVSYKNSTQYRWVVVISPLSILLLGVVGIVVWILVHLRRRNRAKTTTSKTL